jgi:tyrosine-specific transport protein
MTKMNKSLWIAVGTLIGLIIGAGVLGLPYVVAQSGFWTGMLVIIFMGLLALLMNLYVGEITLRTKGTHQLPGYAEKYLGKYGKFFMSLSLLVLAYGAITSYLLGEGQAIGAILNINPLYPMLAFFAIMASIVFRGLKLIKEVEWIINIFIIGVILLIAIFAVPHITLTNYSGFNWTKVFIPYGVALFAFGGLAAIPDLKVELENNKKLMKKAIILGSVIPIILYLLFAASVVGVTGINTTELSTVGLGNMIGEYMILLGNLFAALAMSTSFLLLALALLWMYHYDYKLKRWLAFLLTLSIPLAIALSNYASFVQIIGITGVLAGGLEGIMVILMHRASKRKSERKPEYSLKNYFPLSLLIIFIYLLGMIFLLFF